MAEMANELRRLLPRPIQESTDWKLTFGVAGFLFGLFFHILMKSSNLWVLFVPVGGGPFLAALLFALHPYNPYRNLWARRQGLTDDDIKGDVAARRLLELLRSAKARRVALRTGFYTMGILCLVMSTITVLRTGPFAKSFDIYQIGVLVSSTFLFFVPSGYLQVYFVLRWAIHEYGKPSG
jgi:hypothetical protein